MNADFTGPSWGFVVTSGLSLRMRFATGGFARTQYLRLGPSCSHCPLMDFDEHEAGGFHRQSTGDTSRPKCPGCPSRSPTQRMADSFSLSIHMSDGKNDLISAFGKAG